MSTDDNQPLNGSSAPFARRPVTWGRPPATVFRAGPLPRGERLPPLPEPPASAPLRSSRAAILSGSMIPQATTTPAPAPTSAPAPVPTPAFAPTPAASVVDAPERPSVRPASPGPDLTVRPLPPLPESPAPRRPIPSPVEAAPAVLPVATAARRRPAGRLPVYAGVAAAVIGAVAAGGWMLTRPPAAPPAAPVSAEPAVAPSIPAPATIAAATVVEAVPVAEQPVAEAAPASAATAVRAATVDRPAQASPVVRPPAPVAYEAPQPAPTPVATEPRIEIVPVEPAGPPPTSAERPSADPDAPIATRPQPLN